MSRAQRTSGPPCLDAQASARTDTGGAGEVERIVGSIGLKVFSHRKRMGLSIKALQASPGPNRPPPAPQPEAFNSPRRR